VKEVVELPRPASTKGTTSVLLPPFKGFIKIEDIEKSYLFTTKLHEDSFERVDKCYHATLIHGVQWKIRTIKKSTVSNFDDAKRNNLINQIRLMQTGEFGISQIYQVLESDLNYYIV